MSVTFKYDEPETENVARRCSLSATFATDLNMSHERPVSSILSYDQPLA